ncbi:MAG: DUF2520 domain-containing protein [Blastocatellia bacterium]|nr:DUF2520 domain-containing protein [Blastocatellia bacterium]
MNIFDVTIIGVGRLGGALALALSEKGYRIRELVSRDREKAEEIAKLITPKPTILSDSELEKVSASVIFISTQDSEIQTVADELAEKLENLPFVFHTSGSRSSKILSRLSDEGFEVASFHPLVSFSDSINSVKNFKDAYICVEGDSEAVLIARQIVIDLGGNSFSIEPKYKTLYHASAVTACGHLVALLSVAIEMLSKCGLEQDQAKAILLPLIKSTINNLSTQTPAEALTGTFARADVGTLQEHLKTLRENVSDEMLDVYLCLAVGRLN